MKPLIKSKPITQHAFRPFGSLLKSPKSGGRENFAAELVNKRLSAKTNLALVRSNPAPNKFAVDQLERHPFSTQTFLPLDVGRYLVVVCESDASGNPDLGTVQAFECEGTQGVSYAVGVWHLGMQTLDAPGVFAMLVHEDQTSADCEFRNVEPFEVTSRQS
jgi:ureidoglycolate lyase